MSKVECDACQFDADKLDSSQIQQKLKQLPDWEWIQPDQIDQLSRTFSTRDFVSAMALAQKIETLAESVNHHPQLIIEYGRLTVRWWSHKIKGLHAMDFDMAQKTEKLLTS